MGNVENGAGGTRWELFKVAEEASCDHCNITLLFLKGHCESLWIEKGCVIAKREMLHTFSQKGKENGQGTLVNKTHPSLPACLSLHNRQC